MIGRALRGEGGGVLSVVAATAAVVTLAATLTGSTGQAPGSATTSTPAADSTLIGAPVRTGFQELAAQRYAPLRGQRVGIITNPTGVQADLRHEVDVMHASKDVNLVAVFGPEHGFRGTAQAGGSEGKTIDPQTKLPVYDAYGADTAKLAGMFTEAKVDTVVFDIQDVGSRFYTYIWTMWTGMQAAATTNKKFVVLDRPNPLGGDAALGPILDPKFSSGIGKLPIAQAHGMSVGELATMFAKEHLSAATGGKKLNLSVVKARGWRHGQRYEQTGLPWVPPSPNMPTEDSARVYPGTGMFEGTNLSEGRGSTRPFELIGAPWVDHRWPEELAKQKLPGAGFRQACFVPTFNKYVNETVCGVQVYVTDPRRFDPIRTGLAMIVTAKKLYPAKFSWRETNPKPDQQLFIDKLTGSDYVRKAVDAGRTTDQIVAGWQKQLSTFRAQRAKYLLYPGR